MKGYVHFYHISHSSSYDEKCFTLLYKIKTRILYSIFFFENPVIYEIKWKNTVKPSRAQVTIWCICIS
jgi:hypothetical protein